MDHTWYRMLHLSLPTIPSPHFAASTSPQVDLPNQSLAPLHSALTIRFVTTFWYSCVVSMHLAGPYGHFYYNRRTLPFAATIDKSQLCPHHDPVPATRSPDTSYLHPHIFRQSPSGSNAAKHGVDDFRSSNVALAGRKICLGYLPTYRGES